MKRSWSIIAFLILTAISAFTQSREDIHIYIPPVLASPEQAVFFKENFDMETAAAGYAVTQNPREADYNLKLDVRPNMILYDDGTEEPAPPEESQFVLQLTLIRNEDDVEIVSFTFPFTELEEMYDFNLYLLYEAMANVPFTKPGEVIADDDRWRNKWIYVRGSFDFPIPYYQLKSTNLDGGQAAIWTLKGPDDRLDENGEPLPSHKEIPGLIVNPRPAASIGFEFQYLNWMSTELGFQLRFGDAMIGGGAFIPSIQIEQKFIVKPSKHFMIEPYALIAFPLSAASEFHIPLLAAGGGFQLGVKGGDMGAFFVDLNAQFAVGDVRQKNNHWLYDNPHELHYFHMVIGFGIGYKIGFFDRPKK